MWQRPKCGTREVASLALRLLADSVEKGGCCDAEGSMIQSV